MQNAADNGQHEQHTDRATDWNGFVDQGKGLTKGADAGYVGSLKLANNLDTIALARPESGSSLPMLWSGHYC